MARANSVNDIISSAEASVAAASGVSAGSEPGGAIGWAQSEQLLFAHTLMERGVITREQAEAAIWESSVTGKSVGSSLVNHGVLRNETMLELMEEINVAQISSVMQYNVPIDDPKILHDEKVVLFGLSPNRLYLGCLGNERRVRKHFSRLYPQHDLMFMPVRPSQLSEFLQRAERLPRNTEERMGDARLPLTRYVPQGTGDADVLDMIINIAGVKGASDIHFEPKANSYTVLARINRVRRIIHEGPLAQYQALRAQVKDRSRMDQMEVRKPQDGAYSQEIMGRAFDLRVASFPLTGGLEKIVVRLLDPDKAARALSSLGITKTDDWRAACGYAHGLVYVSGKTNSGKSTTLISSLREQDRIGKAIYTIEDPVEHRVDFITQMAVNRAPTVGLDFTAATRAMMRGDPEIILIGETRDTETAKAAVAVAESGHLVFSTIHAGTVEETVSRLKSFDIDNSLLRPMLRGVLAQRLMRTLCNICRGPGCPHCLMTGYGGMTVVSEMGFFPHAEMFDSMMLGKRHWDPMVKDALLKIRTGITDEREVYRVFRSEIDYLSKEYDGIQELADQVLGVVHGGKPSMVDRTPLRKADDDDHERLRIAQELTDRLAEKSLQGNAGLLAVPDGENPYGDDVDGVVSEADLIVGSSQLAS